jgi:diaminopimelate epimerase
VVHVGEALTVNAPVAGRGRQIWKLCGSGNDFVFFDARTEPAGVLASPGAIQALCARATGVGADGVVFLERASETGTGVAVRMAYYNSDGSRASMCGNAALCTVRLAVELGAAEAAGMLLATDVGALRARIGADGLPEVELPPVAELQAEARAIAREGAERRIGYARAGVPHLVVRVDDAQGVALESRGRTLRHHPSLVDGANVNWVSPLPGGRWRMRTYERGVEGETLACGTGAVACAAILGAWEEGGSEVEILTSSGRAVRVRQPERAGEGPTLAGEGRIVFSGVLGDLG